jgi:AMMECR1 domain-containing protein
MGWFILAQIFTIWITIVRIGRLSEQEKDLEIVVLRRQLAILQRKQEKPAKPNRVEKMMFAVLTAKLNEVTQRPAGHLRGCAGFTHPFEFLANGDAKSLKIGYHAGHSSGSAANG